MLVTLLSVFVLILALTGYVLWLHVRYRIHSAIAPAVVCSIAVVFLFLSGLLNLLPHMSWFLLIGGFILLAGGLFLIRRDRDALRSFLSPGLVFFYLFFVVGSILVKDTLFFQYDHFSHWGLVVKEMERIGGLPDYSTMVGFTNYPPGSALFLFLFVHIVGFSEPIAFIGHVFMMSAFLCVPFVFVSWKQPIALLSLLGITVAIHSSAKHNFFELLVDPLLGYIAAASVFAFLLYQKDRRSFLITFVPFTSLLVLTKDSGKLFFVSILIYILMYVLLEKKGSRRDWFKKKSLVVIGLVVGVTPFILDFLWKRYVDKAYPANEVVNKFAMNRNTFLNPSKTPEFVEAFLPKMGTALIKWDLVNTRVLLSSFIAVLLVVIVIWFLKKKPPTSLLKTIAFSVGFLGFYVIMLFTMYFFLMPEAEAIRLAGFNRYMNSVVLFISLLLVVQAIITLTAVTPKIRTILSVIMVGIFLFAVGSDLGNGIAAPVNASELRTDLHKVYHEVKQTAAATSEDSFLVVDTSNVYSSDYIRYIIDYERSTGNNQVLSSCIERSTEEMEETLSKAQYLLSIDVSEEEAACLEDVIGMKVSGNSFYPLSKKE
ncbi:hypothetical protein ACI2JA_08220 [Alkalihalobacillus sp. NPDC078783]